jgi:CubicO group peptidase (beta-lactamase class C family)
VKDGQVLLAKGYGFSDVEKSIKATEQTVYQLASVTKQFTAASILMLVDEGKLSLDARITDVLPGLPEAWKPVTVRHLLTHTSGIKSYTDVFGAQKIPNDRVFTHEQILALVKDAPLEAAPGTRFAYCNTGYYLLGMIVEKVSGQNYADFVAKRIFAPLGMTSSGYDDYADARPVRAKGYNTNADGTVVAPHTHPSQPFAAGALVSTVADMAKWDAALTARKLLSPGSYDAMWTPAKGNDGTSIPYGFGWQINPFHGHKRIAHGGGITGFSTFITRLPDDKVTVIVLANQSGNAAGQIANSVSEIVAPALVSPKP